MIIWDWVSYFFHALWQNILLYIPLLKPEKEPVDPYDFFFDCEDFYASWGQLLDEERRPTHSFMSDYWDCMWQILVARLEDRIWVITGYATDWIVIVIGILPDPFTTVAEWLVKIWALIGAALPIWATDLVSGLEALWNFLPEPIREGLQTWAEFIGSIPEAFEGWVIEYIGWAIDWINELWDWFISLGQGMTVWWEWVEKTLSDFVSDAYGFTVRVLGDAWVFLVWFWSDPAGVIVVLLSPWWKPLVTFAADCLDFWYNLWGSYADDLAELLADPLEFLWNRGELWLSDRLERP